MTETVKIIVNGATGGIANRQHLSQALVPIIREGGLRVGDKTIQLELILVARDEQKLAEVAARYGIDKWTTDLDAALSDPSFTTFFDAGHTGNRANVLRRAIAAGKDVYTEKPVVTDLIVGSELLALADDVGAKVGVVEDKLFLPGMSHLRQLAESDYFGTVTNFRMDWGFWFFDGFEHKDQRGSWNYKSAEGGGLALDTYPHWRYVVEGILGPIKKLVARSWTAVADRVDEHGVTYRADADDSSVVIVEMESGAIGTISSSVSTRVRRDDLLSFQIDGTNGSAVGGLHRCYIQPSAATPSAAWNPNVDLGVDYRQDWMRLPVVEPAVNGQRKGWEAFIRHVTANEVLKADLRAGLRDIALAKAVLASSDEGRWVDLGDFTV